MENNLSKWLYSLSIPLFFLNLLVTIIPAVKTIIYYGIVYIIFDVVYVPILFVTTTGILFFIIETIKILIKKKVSQKIIIFTFITMTLSLISPYLYILYLYILHYMIA